MKISLCGILTLLVIGTISSAAQSRYEANWESLDSRPLPGWFDDAKFGIFIHWGIYAVPAWAPTGGDNVYAKYAEWYWKRYDEQRTAGSGPFLDFHNAMYGEEVRYQDFVKDFRAELFEPAQWAALFKRAGARYVVLTSKHHEGFALWPSQESWNWNAADVGPHRDLAGDLSAAVKSAGLRFGFYYSLYEWFNPLYHSDVDRYVSEHMLPQFKDLVTRYEPDIVWPDGEWDHPSSTWRSEEFLAWLYNESAVRDHVVVNDRWGKETRSAHGSFYTTEYGLVHDGAGLAGDAAFHKWEECRGIGGSFGYNRAETLADYSSSEELVHLLIETVSRGGNLLLNIGPTADGRIPVIMQQRLVDMGSWLNVNGEAIYGTRRWTKPAEGSVRFTAKQDTVYAIALAWPGDQLVLNGIPELDKRARIELLGFRGSLDWQLKGDRLTVTMPSPHRLSAETGNYAYTLRITGFKPPAQPSR